MASNSNFNITKVVVDATSQEITSLEVNGKAVSTGSSVELESNKTATINVNTYTEPVEITPSEGKDAMEKATITLSNIPVPGGLHLYAWQSDLGAISYTFVEEPTDNDQALYADYSTATEVSSVTLAPITSYDADSIEIYAVSYTRNQEHDIVIE